MINPKITIITTVKNDEKRIEKTILSVLSQNYKNLEYIVIDGGSTDATLEIIKKYSSKLSYWEINKEDKGIYDGFNRGLNFATGDLIGIVNSGDIYTERAFEYLIKYYNLNPNVDFFFGAVKKHYATLHGYKPYKIKYSWGFYTSHSTGFFIKQKAFKKVGYYDLKYKISSDYDYFYRMIVQHKLKGVASKKSELFGIFARGGYSSRFTFFERTLEELLIRKNNNQHIITILFILIIKIIFNYKYLK
jgi:glycosyltransferase involved in cell wall biosynthesis